MQIGPNLKKWGVRAALWLAVAGLGWAAHTFFGVERPDPGPLPTPPVIPWSEIVPAEEDGERLYFCGNQETVRDTIARRWPTDRITWTLDTGKSPIPAQQAIEAFRVAWAAWADKLEIEAVYVDKPAEALVLSRFEYYDGPGQVLAWSHLANGTMTPKHQVYDTAERWGVSATPTNQIDLVRVACHEIGHVLGLVHEDPPKGALMDPTYSRSVRFPTEQDVTRAVALGYKRRVRPAPAPPAGPSGTLSFPVQAKTADVVDALRKEGFTVEAPKK